MDKLIKKLEELHDGYTVRELKFSPPLEHPMPEDWWEELIKAIDGVEPSSVFTFDSK